MSLTNSIELELLDHLFGNAAYSPPATYYLAASTADPGEDGSGLSEPSGNNYSRVAIANNTTKFPAATSVTGVGTKTNGEDESFPVSTGPWGTITHWALMDASSGGNVVISGAFDSSVSINNSEILTVQAGSLTITCD